MHLIDAPGNLAGLFTNGNPLASPKIPSTIFDADWLNMLQLELQAVVLASGGTPTKGDNGQLLAALQVIIPGLVTAALASEMAFQAPAALTAGDGQIVVNTFGVVKSTVASGFPATLLLAGSHTLPKKAVFIEAGARVWWDNNAKLITDVPVAGFWEVGIALEERTSGEPEILIGLFGKNAPSEVFA